MNFTVALVDKAFNQFKIAGPDLTREHVAKIQEHHTRLDEISIEAHFFIDEEMYKQLGNQGIPFKFTRVFSKNPDLIKPTKYIRVHHINQLATIVDKTKKYSEFTDIFFVGSSEFQKRCISFTDRLLLTRIDHDFTNEATIVDKFPAAEFKKTFTKRKTVASERLIEIRKYKRQLEKKRNDLNRTVADNGMTIIETVKLPDFELEILNTPDYEFHEFRR